METQAKILKDEPSLEIVSNDELSSILQAFPSSRFYPRLVFGQGERFMYKLKRELETFDDVVGWEKYDYELAIWFKNETILSMSKGRRWEFAGRRLCFALGDSGETRNAETFVNCAIFGETDAAIAETATFLLSLKHFSGFGASLRVEYYDDHTPTEHDEFSFDVASLSPEQLTHILDANPHRMIDLETGVWTPEQSVILASRPYAMTLKLTNRSWGWGGINNFEFEDKGAAFVAALEKRQRSFGSLSIAMDPEDMFISSDNLKKMLKLDVFHTFSSDVLNEEYLLLPFSTKVQTLHCVIDADRYNPEHFDNLDIVASELHLKMCNFRYAEDLLRSLFHRLSVLGHFEKFGIQSNVEDNSWMDADDFDDETSEDVERLVQTLIHAIIANPNLSCLDLGSAEYLFNLSPKLLDNLFLAFEQHEGLRTVFIDCQQDYDFNYPALETLLSRNLDITVRDGSGKRISNGKTIEWLYLKNGSARLVTKSLPVRPQLLATALLEIASRNFHYSAFLLSEHSDVLCELIEGIF